MPFASSSSSSSSDAPISVEAGICRIMDLLYAGGSVASYFTMSRHVGYSLGASGAVFGLFAVSVLCKLSFNLKKLLEAAILGQFVV